MSAERREHFSSLDRLRGKADRTATRSFTPYEVEIRETMRQRRRKRFTEVAAALGPAIRSWPGPRRAPLPREVILVDHAHTPMGQAIYDAACEMRDKHMYLRPAQGHAPAITCETLP